MTTQGRGAKLLPTRFFCWGICNKRNENNNNNNNNNNNKIKTRRASGERRDFQRARVFSARGSTGGLTPPAPQQLRDGHPMEKPPPLRGALPGCPLLLPRPCPGFRLNFHPASLGKMRTPPAGAEVWRPAQFHKPNGMKNVQNKHTPPTPHKPPPGGCSPQAPTPPPRTPPCSQLSPSSPQRQPAPNASLRANRQTPTGSRRPGGLRGNLGVPLGRREGGPFHLPILHNRSPADTWPLPERHRTNSE